MQTAVAEHPRGVALARLRLVHPFPSLLVAALTMAMIPFADPEASLSLYVVLGLGMLCYQFAIGVANDVVDAGHDAATKPWKPIPSGVVSSRSAKLLAAVFAGAGLIVTSTLDFGPWLIGIAGLFCGLAYDVHLKRTSLSWLPWAIAFPLIPAWVYSAAGAWDDVLWWTLPLGSLLAIALYFANQAPGAPEERSLDGLAQRLGERASRAAAVTLFGLVSSAAILVLLFVGRPQALFAAIAAALTAMLIPRAQLRFGRDGLFGVLAGGSSALALAFLAAA